MNNNHQSNIRNLVAACAAITVFGLAFGMTYPLLSLILESRGVSPGMIGINAAMMPIGILLFSSVIPWATGRLGAKRVAVIAALVTAALIICYKLFDNLEAWFVLRLLQGMSISTLFVLSEAWIVGFAGSRHRGRIVAVYASILSASFGAGPALVGWLGIDGWLPFVIGSVVILLGVLPLSMLQEDKTVKPTETTASGFLGFAPKAPMLLVAVGVFAIFDAATLSLLPVYGIRTGLDLNTAALALSVMIIGNIALQFPIGWMADKLPRRAVLAGCALTAAAALACLPATMGSSLMWPVLVVTGAAGYAVYTVALTALGDRFQGNELVEGSSAFAVMWGMGALIGTVSAGWSMTAFGPHGLPLYLGVTFILLGIGMMLRARRLDRGRPKA